MTFGDRFGDDVSLGCITLPCEHQGAIQVFGSQLLKVKNNHSNICIIEKESHRNIIKWEKAGENGLNRFKLAVWTEEKRT